MFFSQDKFWASSGSATIPTILQLGDSLFFHHVVLFSTTPKPNPPLASSSSSSRNAVPPPSPSQRPTSDPSTVAHHIITTLLSQIRIERSGEVVSRSAIQSVVEILCSLTDEGPIPLPVLASAGVGAGSPVVGGGANAAGLRNRTVMGEGTSGARESPYKTSFEQALLKQTEEFYTRESERLLVECDCPSFLQKVSLPRTQFTYTSLFRFLKAEVSFFYLFPIRSIDDYQKNKQERDPTSSRRPNLYSLHSSTVSSFPPTSLQSSRILQPVSPS